MRRTLCRTADTRLGRSLPDEDKRALIEYMKTF